MRENQVKSVYFVAPLFAKDKYGKYYKQIASFLREYNYKVLSK